MADEDKLPIPPTFLEKLTFYTTATFVLLATFSLFAFLFLVPFVIEPAFTTIFMQFDVVGAFCVTSHVKYLEGASNCSWTSCKEGCTKDVYQCTQIRVNYKLGIYPNVTDVETLAREERAIRDYESYESYEAQQDRSYPDLVEEGVELGDVLPTGLQGDDSEWYFTGARLYPNVKGCGYPPMLNCTIWMGKYRELGTNFTCYYSKVDPGLVVSDLDMWQNTLNLVYAIAIPIPSFIISVIYLTFAYFKIYNTEEEEAEEKPLQSDAEAMATGGDDKPTTPGSDTFREDLADFGHQLKMQLEREKSMEGFESHSPPLSNSASLSGTKSSFVNA